MIIMNRLVVLLALGLICSYEPVRCARILAVFPFASRSHYILGNSLLRGLAEAGHDVTMISGFEDKVPPKNGTYRNVVLTGFVEYFQEMTKKINLFENNLQSILAPLVMMKMMFPIIDETFAHPNVKALLNSDEQFDVVIVEKFMNDAMNVLANHFNAPLILLSSVGASSWVNEVVGNPSPPSYIPHMISDLPESMTFFQRVKNFLSYAMDYTFQCLFILPKNQQIAKKHLPNDPDLLDVYHDASLVLLNSHESLNQAVPLVPNMVQIGGYHVTPPKKLPKDLQDYLDNAKEGVVYFSLGSNLKSKDLPTERRDMFLKAFSKLKQKVLWKWEADELPGQPPNVKLGKWLPQQDILAHPNVKVFITHGGLLSTTETVYHGVPILAIPVFADQHKNAEGAVQNGFALSLPYKDPSFSEERLSEKLNELLNNPRYTDNVKERSRLFHDRPLKPMETAVYWIEYVIRHKGAPHLRVAGAKMPLYKYLLLDVIAFLILVNIIMLSSVALTIRYFIRRRKRTTKTKKVKRS